MNISGTLTVVSIAPKFSVSSVYIKYADIAPDVTKDLLAINVDAIGVSLVNLLTTEKGERLNLPEYGVNVSDYLFEIIDDITSQKLLLEVYTAVSIWETRAELDLAKSYVIGRPDSHAYEFYYVFNLVGLTDITIEYSGILSRFKSALSMMYASD